MAETSFWWTVLTKAGNILANTSEKIIGEKLQGQIETRLKPALKLLEDPKARSAFDEAFAQAPKNLCANQPTTMSDNSGKRL